MGTKVLSEIFYRDLLDGLANAVFLVNSEDISVEYANARAAQVFGFSDRDVAGISWPVLFGLQAGDFTQFLGKIRSSLADCGVWRGEARGLGKQGQTLWCWLDISVWGEFWVVLCQDITDRKVADDALRASERLHRRLMESTLDIVYTFSIERGGIYYSPHVMQVLGYTPEQLCASPLLWNQSIHPDDREKVQEVIKDFEFGKLFDIEYRIRDVHGNWIWLRDRSIRRQDADGEILIEGMATDITRRKQMESHLSESEALYRDLIETRPDLLCVWMPDTTLTFVNKAYCDFFGKTREELLGQSWLVLIPEHDREAVLQKTHELVQHPSMLEYEHYGVAADGTNRWLAWNDIPVFDANGELVKFQSVGHDITGRKRAEDVLRMANAALRTQLEEIQGLQDILREQATRDSLTGLYNRRYLYDTLDRELAQALRNQSPLGVMMIDVDHFKDFNDRHGHQAGDAVLVAIGRLLQQSTRLGDIACRYGGEEFILVMPGAGREDLLARADSIRQDFGDLRIFYSGVGLSATISIGVAYHPHHGNTMNEIIKAADAALYAAKQDGRNCVRIWDA